MLSMAAFSVGTVNVVYPNLSWVRFLALATFFLTFNEKSGDRYSNSDWTSILVCLFGLAGSKYFFLTRDYTRNIILVYKIGYVRLTRNLTG